MTLAVSTLNTCSLISRRDRIPGCEWLICVGNYLKIRVNTTHISESMFSAP